MEFIITGLIFLVFILILITALSWYLLNTIFGQSIREVKEMHRSMLEYRPDAQINEELNKIKIDINSIKSGINLRSAYK